MFSYIKSHIRPLKSALITRLIPLRSRKPWINRVHYLLSSDFNGEFQAVIAGKQHYRERIIRENDWNPQLRRNIHRLEKGLSMEPKRPVFALSYIEETVECFSYCVNIPTANKEELKWANDVLETYFDRIDDHEGINNAKKLFYSVKSKLPSLDTTIDYIPYIRRESIKSNITFSEFEKLCQQRRSVRWFKDKPVPIDLIRKATNIASLAPSACNRQPFRFHVTTNKKLATKIAEIAPGTSGYSQNIPCTIVIVGDLSAYQFERDRHLIYVDGALASMQFMLCLETLELGSCAINWPDLRRLDKEMGERLNLKTWERPIMLIGCGYPKDDGSIPYSQKKPNEVLLREIS